MVLRSSPHHPNSHLLLTPSSSPLLFSVPLFFLPAIQVNTIQYNHTIQNERHHRTSLISIPLLQNQRRQSNHNLPRQSNCNTNANPHPTKHSRMRLHPSKPKLKPHHTRPLSFSLSPRNEILGPEPRNGNVWSCYCRRNLVTQ